MISLPFLKTKPAPPRGALKLMALGANTRSPSDSVERHPGFVSFPRSSEKRIANDRILHVRSQVMGLDG